MSRGAARRLGATMAARRNGANPPPNASGWVAVDTDAGQGYLLNNENEAAGFADMFADGVGGRDQEDLVWTYPVLDLRQAAQPTRPNERDVKALLDYADRAAFFIVDYTEDKDPRVGAYAMRLHDEFVALRDAFPAGEAGTILEGTKA